MTYHTVLMKIGSPDGISIQSLEDDIKISGIERIVEFDVNHVHAPLPSLPLLKKLQYTGCWDCSFSYSLHESKENGSLPAG